MKIKQRVVSICQEAKHLGLNDPDEAHVRQLIRARRLAERLIHDVLGGEFEEGACEFEHMGSTKLIDSLCTLLGHPKECPHGLPIPEGECCKRSKDFDNFSDVL